MESDEGKLFIGGIAWDTSEETLTEYFTQYGQVTQAVIMREKPTGRPRGFGFVVFSDPSVLDRVLQERHTIDGRTVSPPLSRFIWVLLILSSFCFLGFVLIFNGFCSAYCYLFLDIGFFGSLRQHEQQDHLTIICLSVSLRIFVFHLFLGY